MKASNVLSVFENKIRGWATIPCAYPNKSFNTSGLKEYIKYDIVFSTPQIGEVQIDGEGKNNGVLKISIYTELNQGLKRSLDIAESLITLFSMKCFSGISTDKAFYTPSESENTFYKTVFTVTFSFIG